MKKEKLEKEVLFLPAFDKRNDNPKKNFGIGAVRCFMVLKGKKGAVCFQFSTGILLPKTILEYIKKGLAKYEIFPSGGDHYHFLNSPMGFDVGYHARKPQYKGQKVGQRTCMFLNDKRCYYDGSGMRAEAYMNVLTEKGSDAIWKMLEGEYKLLI